MRFGLPILLLLMPVLAITGLFVTWEQDSNIIEREYPSYISVLAGYSHQTSVHDGEASSKTQRSYWLIPKTLESPKILSITYSDFGGVEHEATQGGFWFALVSVIFIGVTCYFVWVRGYDPFNKSKHAEL